MKEAFGVKQLNRLSLFSKNNLQPPTKFCFEMSSMRRGKKLSTDNDYL